MSARFQVLFHSPPGVLFTIPSRYSSAIGHREVFRRPSGLGRFTQDSTGPVLLGAAPAQPAGFRLRGCHPLRPPIPGDSATRPVQCTAPRRGGDGKNAPQTTPRPQPPPGIARARFNHHPLPLATTHGISTPAGTEMFHFPASPPAPYDIQTRVTPHNGRRVPPFGNPRITARKPAPRGISQATASFIGPRCQGIHRTLIKTNNTQQHNTRRTRDAHHTGARRTTNQTKKQTNGRPAAQFTIPRPPADARVHYAVHNQPAHNPRPHPSRRGPRGPDTRAHRPRTRQHATPPHTPAPQRAEAEEGMRRGGGARAPAPRRGTRAPSARGQKEPLRKEVIQPHLPVRLPCYDFVPIANPTFDRSP